MKRIPTNFCVGIASAALTFFIVVLYLRHQREWWALVVALAFMAYPYVPKLPEHKEVKPEKYSLVS